MSQRLGILLVFVAFMGCSSGSPSGTSDRKAFISADSWYAPPKNLAVFTPLEKEKFAPVAADLQAEAETALSEVSFKQITADEASRLVGRPLPNGQAYVLFRAVVLKEGTGGFHVSLNGSAVHVQHGCLGRIAVPMKRKVLIAVLPAVPKSVFVSCSMAE